MNRKVTIIWRYLPDYRVAFYQRLRDDLLRRNIQLNLIYGRTNGNSLNGATEGALPWAKCVDHWRGTIRGIELCWQPYCRYIRDADLVILEQANRLLLNYWLIAKRPFTQQKIAFLGHGRDLQAAPGSIRNNWKRLFIRQVDWWFAYSEGVREEVIRHSFPPERVTNVQNAYCTDVITSAKAKISLQQLDSLRIELGLGFGPIGIYCGRLYKEKRLAFLLEAASEVKKCIPSFELIVIGSGPEQHKILQATHEAAWLHYVGSKFEEEKVPYFLLSDVFLLPGAVGLAIIDAFALEVPLVTTKFAYHGPEIAYLQSGHNGLITENNVHEYATGVCQLLKDPLLLATLKNGCREAASIYTVQTMVEKFCEGIVACLEA